MGRGTRWVPVAATAAVVAVLTGGAAVTADKAGCDDPGRWMLSGGELELVGGCLDSADLPVAPPPSDPDTDASVPQLGD